MFCGYDEEKVYTYIFYRDTVIGETVENSLNVYTNKTRARIKFCYLSFLCFFFIKNILRQPFSNYSLGLMAFTIFSISEEGFSWFGFAGFNASVIFFFRAPVYNGGNHQAALRSKTPHVIRW